VRGGEEPRHDRRWFADEVAIDFPSVAPAIERMRSAFVAEEHAKTLTAAVEISPREAIEGATVPLDVPVRCTCRACGGRGETWAQPCAACAGAASRLIYHRCTSRLPPASKTAPASISRCPSDTTFPRALSCASFVSPAARG
jgi:hypothetical protein